MHCVSRKLTESEELCRMLEQQLEESSQLSQQPKTPQVEVPPLSVDEVNTMHECGNLREPMTMLETIASKVVGMQQETADTPPQKKLRPTRRANEKELRASANLASSSS